LADFGRLSIPGMVTQTGGRSINTQVLRARIAESRSVWIAALALPFDPDRARPLERLSAAAMGYGRLSGALVRRLSGPQPLDRFRAVFALWRGFEILDQSRHSGAGDAVDPANNVARARRHAAVSAGGDQPLCSR
jgi:hypothetical protein